MYHFPWKLKLTVTTRLFLSKQCFACNLQASFQKKGGRMKSFICRDLLSLKATILYVICHLASAYTLELMCLKYYITQNAWSLPFLGLNIGSNSKWRQYVSYCCVLTLHYSEENFLGYFVESQHLQLHCELAQLLPSYRDVRKWDSCIQ